MMTGNKENINQEDREETIKSSELLAAYRLGFFPMASSSKSKEIEWYCPEERGIIPLDKVHLPKRLWRTLKTTPYQITTNKAFQAVMVACAAPQKGKEGREETWISDEIITIYTKLHHEGYAHSVEVWNLEGQLIGGLYGVSLGAAFFGESMFSFERDSSKIALMYLIAALRQGGYELLDTQYITPHLQRFGGIAVPFLEYRSLLSRALAKEGRWSQEITLSALSGEFQKLREQVGDSL